MTVKDDQLNPDDLNLVDDHLEDEGKDDDTLWQEFDDAENTGSAASTADDDTTIPDDDKSGGDDEDGKGGDDWTAEQDGEDAASAAGDDDQQDDRSGKQPDQPGQAQQDDDVWVNATPKQRAAYEAAQAQLKKLEQADRSNRGRLSALQLKINELTASPAAPAKDAATKGKDGQQDDDTDLLNDPDLKQVVEEYPEVAGPFVKIIGKLQSHIAKQEKVLSAIGEDRRQSALDEQENLLLEAHADAFDVVQDKGFVTWLNTQPRHIREAALRNAENIVDAEEAADVVGRFKTFRADQPGGGNAQRQTTDARASGNNSNQRPMSGKRQRQLASATTARSRGPGAASGIAEDGDPEQIWKQFDAMEARQAGRG